MEEYAATLKECIDECKYKVVILIDSLDDLSELDELSWLPSQLGENAKVVITATTAGWDITDATKCESPGVLSSLCDRLPKESFVQLHQYSGEKWDDIMTAGSDCSYASPQMWRNCVERTPAQAKVSFVQEKSEENELRIEPVRLHLSTNILRFLNKKNISPLAAFAMASLDGQK